MAKFFFYDGENSASDATLSSFYVGFYNESKITPMLFFGTGLEYFQNGSSLPLDTKYKQHLMSIPLYLKFKIGPVFAIWGASANFIVAQNYTIGENKINVPEAFKSNWFDVPLHGGLGVSFLMFTVEAKYYWGLLDSFKNTPGSVQYFQVGGAISF